MCLDCEHDKTRHLETVDVLIYAYGLLVGGKGLSFFGTDGLKWMESSWHSQGTVLGPV